MMHCSNFSTFILPGINNNGWWGEGEIKFYLDGDREFPTVCGTGTEDYFCGSYNFENRETRQYQEFATPYAGLHQVIRPDGVSSATAAAAAPLRSENETPPPDRLGPRGPCRPRVAAVGRQLRAATG